MNEEETAIFSKLKGELNPTELEVRDISGGCGSMYFVSVCSELFRGLPMIKQQRLVNDVLKDKIAGWHGLRVKTSVP